MDSAVAVMRATITSYIICVICCLSQLCKIDAFAPKSLLSLSNIRRFKSSKAHALSSSSKSSPPSKTYDLVVIGGGSAGITAAKFAANFGKSVCLVESSRVGGDCTWTGCVPSKTLLAAAKQAWIWQQMNEKYGASIDDISIRKMLRNVKNDIDENRNRIYEEDDSPAVLKALGIDLAEGKANFRDAQTIDVTNEVDGTIYQFRATYGIVIATGASNDPKNIAGLDDSVPHWTYENVWDEFFDCIEQDKRQKVREKKVIVVGGGPIGCELSQAISRLGCSVTIISSADRLLPTEEVIASQELQHVFEKEGIEVICNHRVTSVVTSNNGDAKSIQVLLDNSDEPIVGDHILVATGRIPNIRNLGLGKIGVQINSETNGIQVDVDLQTSVKGVYAAGDCTGDRQFTHYAGYQGAIAARNILLPLKDAGVLGEVPSTIFTDPEVASFGLTEQAARDQYGDGKVSVSFRPLSKVDRAVCEGTEAHGFIKIIYQTRSKQILGATIMSPSAGELISEVSVAKDAKLSFDQLSTVMHSYPSYSIALQQMAADVYYDKLKKSKFLYDVLKKFGL